MLQRHFHALTLQYNGLANRIVTTVDIYPAFDPIITPPPFKPHSTNALWDTGASGSVVTIDTIRSMGLTPIGKVQVNHGGGSDERDTFIVNFVLPNHVMIPGVIVVAMPNTSEFGAIIGMDIIARGDFSITNINNETCMSFRIPSITRIDYADEATRIRFSGTGRNDPCPCGSGKKYKHCHGAPQRI